MDGGARIMFQGFGGFGVGIERLGFRAAVESLIIGGKKDQPLSVQASSG